MSSASSGSVVVMHPASPAAHGAPAAAAARASASGFNPTNAIGVVGRKWPIAPGGALVPSPSFSALGEIHSIASRDEPSFAFGRVDYADIPGSADVTSSFAVGRLSRFFSAVSSNLLAAVAELSLVLSGFTPGVAATLLATASP